MGEKKIDTLLEHLPGLFRDKVSLENIIAIKGFSDKTASVVIENLNTVKEFLKEMEPFIKPEETEKTKDVMKESTKDAMKDVKKESTKELTKDAKKVVFSGFRDSSLEKKCKENNIEVMTSISKNTNILIVKDMSKTSTKIDKANELGITIMNLDEFLQTLK